jgi:glycine/D-amino acid oxidase-like deaminating enzyme
MSKANMAEVVAVASSGCSLRCHTLIFATGYEFPKFVPLNGHKLISTYALATRPQSRRLWPERCLIWEASDPYLYMRTTTDGRAVIGGEDEEFVDEAGRDALLNAKIERIGKKVLKLFPDLDVTPEYAWAGTFGSSETGLPSIGKIPRHPNCWAVLGYGGNGITYSRIAAEIIRTSLAGGVDPDADLYAF